MVCSGVCGETQTRKPNNKETSYIENVPARMAFFNAPTRESFQSSHYLYSITMQVSFNWL